VNAASAASSPNAVQTLPNYGIDADRVLAVDGWLPAMRRRLDGQYAVDEFGGDPHFMDLCAPLAAPVRVVVEHGENLPRTGPALLVANRGLGVLEPVVIGQAVRRAVGRRLRVIGAPELPVIGPLLRKLGAIGYRADDVAAMLRAGHLAAAPLGPTWYRHGAGEPPSELLVATLGFPVIPIGVRAIGPFGVPARGWRVIVGEALLPPAGTDPEDLLAAAELAEEVRRAVRGLLVDPA
jgi:hypothetical protein